MICLALMTQCDRQTDRQTDGGQNALCIASRGQK